VDGSRHSDAAIAAVAKLAGQCAAPVIAISAAIDARLGDDARAIVQAAKDWLAKAGVTATAEMRVGAADAVIADAAKDRHADLIVMGSHGRTGLDRLLVGSVSERVIGRATCPVMVVRA
jgi:nucleotide-binding universal stress UspA family protein